MLLILGVFLLLSLGRYSNDPVKVLNVILSQLGLSVPADPAMVSIIFNVRLLRAVASVLVGAMLSLSVAVY